MSMISGRILSRSCWEELPCFRNGQKRSEQMVMGSRRWRLSGWRNVWLAFRRRESEIRNGSAWEILRFFGSDQKGRIRRNGEGGRLRQEIGQKNIGTDEAI